MKAMKVAAVMASTAVIVGAAFASYLVHPSASGPSEDVTYYESVTLTIGASGDTDTRVSYTCADAVGNVDVCGPEPVSTEGVWHKKVSVPPGTVVRVQARGGVLPPHCWISDKSDQITLASNESGQTCEAVAS